MPRHGKAAILCAFWLALAGCDDDAAGTFTGPDMANSALVEASGGALLTDGVWKENLAPIVPARAAAAAGFLNRTIIVVGGENRNGGAMSRVDAYDLDTKTWSRLPSLPAPRAFPFGATPINGKLYVAGGSTAPTGGGFQPKNSLYVYDPGTWSWSRKADLPLAAWSAGVQAAINGRLYVYYFNRGIGPGENGLFIRYDPARDQWTYLPAPPRQHQGMPVGGTINGRFYLAGGGHGDDPSTGNLDMFDPATGTWTEKRSMRIQHDGAMAAVFQGKLVVAGGMTIDPFTARPIPGGDLEIYDPVTDTWTSGPPMPTARWNGAAAFARGRIYFIGGRTDSYQPIRIVEAYVP
jgi:N-acetylneuraminic acid mutarotase